MGIVRRLAIVLVAMIVLVGAPAVAHADDAPPSDETPITSPAQPPDEPTDPGPGDDEVAPPPGSDAEAPDSPPTPAPQPGPRPTFIPVKRYNVLKKLVFPVVGLSKYWAGFGDCRDNCTREHHGIDILTYGFKGLPVVAAHDGTVVKVTYDEGNPGCSVRIRGRDGWETRYYHLNNDEVGTDEMGHACPAPGIEVGTEVVAGQIIGYVGDSGNSEHTVPHLHFELRNRSGYPIDPYRSLRAADKVVFEWLPTFGQAASITLAQSTHPDTARVLVVVPSDELPLLGASEVDQTILMAPLVVIDRDDPQGAIDEIRRLQPDRIVGLTEGDGFWLRERLSNLAPIVAVDRITTQNGGSVPIPHDAEEARELNVPDRFVTVIAGVVDRIWRSRLEAYQTYTSQHRSVVLVTEKWAPRRIGVGSWTYPGKNADKTVVWWITGDGWIPTDPGAPPPVEGTPYVTEQSATPGTLGFLGSLAELPPMPVWRSS